MSTAGISFSGLASGLDTKSIIAALIAVEERPIRTLEQKKTSLNKQKSLYGDLRSLLDKLSTAAKALKRTDDFLEMKATSSNEEVLTASAGSSAAAGTYKFKVNDLAKAQVNATTGSASPTTSLGFANGWEFDLVVGGNPYTLTPSGDNIQAIAAAINDKADEQDLKVRADVVDTGNTANGGANRYQLVIRSTEAGTANAFSVSAASGPEQTFFNTLNTTGVRTAATDAQLELEGGIVITRTSNTISDVIPGVTLNLLAENANEVTITVTADAEATAKKVQDFADAYNKVVDFFVDQNVVDGEGKAKSPLFGDSSLRSMRSSLRSIMGTAVTGSGNEAYQMLSQLGVTSDKNGKLTFNRSKFEEALGEDESAVAAVFTNSSLGIAGRLETQIDLYTDTVEGLIKTRSETFDRQVRDTQSRIDRAEKRLELYEKQLETRYANLESLLSKLQSQGSAVGGFGRR